MQQTAIIIPCYNEEKRIRRDEIAALVNSTQADIYFCNDGSKDNTLAVLHALERDFPGRCFVYNYEKNTGKANTVYTSVNKLLEDGRYTHIGYFDADFSTPSGEMIRMLHAQEEKPERFIFGSRVLLLNSRIERKTHRHYIGRIIITLINFKFRLKVYDTQCGAKLFPNEIASAAFSGPFKTAWLFDVEVFLRLKKYNLLHLGWEFPLAEWHDIDGSKISWRTGFKILKELVSIYRNYA